MLRFSTGLELQFASAVTISSRMAWVSNARGVRQEEGSALARAFSFSKGTLSKTSSAPDLTAPTTGGAPRVLEPLSLPVGTSSSRMSPSRSSDFGMNGFIPGSPSPLSKFAGRCIGSLSGGRNSGSASEEASSLLARRRSGTRLHRDLSVATDKQSLYAGRRSIRQCRNFCELYQLGKVVMPSCHRAMEIRFATKVMPKGSTELARQVVVKVRRKPGSFSSPEDEKAWRQNTELVMNLPDSPGIVRIDEVLEDSMGYYVVMEKVEGLDLHESVHEQGPMPLADIKVILRQLLQAVGDMHAHGCIHKDLKLENVMLDTRSDHTSSTTTSSPKRLPTLGVKLIDFDTVEDYSPKTPSRAKRVLGTDQYIAPEAYEGKYSPASDIFAIGVIAYRLLANSFPFEEDIFDDKPGENWVGSPKMKEIRDKLESVRLDWQKRNLASLPTKERKAAQRLIARMMSFREEQRPTAAEALRDPWLAVREPPQSQFKASRSCGNLSELPGGGGHFAWSQRAARRNAGGSQLDTNSP